MRAWSLDDVIPRDGFKGQGGDDISALRARTQYAGDVRRWMWAGLWWAWMGEGQQHVGFSARGQALQILTDDPLRAQRPCERGWLQ